MNVTDEGRQRLGVCSRWRVKRPPLAQIPFFGDWTLVIVFGEREPFQPSILRGKFRTGHEAAICSSRPSAAKRRNPSALRGEAHTALIVEENLQRLSIHFHVEASEEGMC